MKIAEISSLNLNECTFKLSNKSITVKGGNNKTKAIINDVQSVNAIPFNRKVDLNIKFQGKLNKFFDSLYVSNNNALYYIVDQKYHEVVCRWYANGDTEEFQRLQEKIKTLTDLNVNVLFLNVA